LTISSKTESLNSKLLATCLTYKRPFKGTQSNSLFCESASLVQRLLHGGTTRRTYRAWSVDWIPNSVHATDTSSTDVVCSVIPISLFTCSELLEVFSFSFSGSVGGLYHTWGHSEGGGIRGSWVFGVFLFYGFFLNCLQIAHLDNMKIPRRNSVERNPAISPRNNALVPNRFRFEFPKKNAFEIVWWWFEVVDFCRLGGHLYLAGFRHTWVQWTHAAYVVCE